MTTDIGTSRHLDLTGGTIDAPSLCRFGFHRRSRQPKQEIRLVRPGHPFSKHCLPSIQIQYSVIPSVSQLLEGHECFCAFCHCPSGCNLTNTHQRTGCRWISPGARIRKANMLLAFRMAAHKPLRVGALAVLDGHCFHWGAAHRMPVTKGVCFLISSVLSYTA
jgi:hypothetical protein